MDTYLNNADIYYVKKNVEYREYFMHQYIHKLNIVNIPNIMAYDEENKILVMKKVGTDNLSNIYGEEAIDVPDELFEQVAKIVCKLVLHGINYPDLTGYNFIEDNDGSIWIIDFEHATFITDELSNIHIKNICNGEKKWNPEFK